MERLILCGGGHIASQLAPLGRALDWDVVVIDDRIEFANEKRFPGCQVLCGAFEECLNGLRTGPRDHVVIVTRGHAGDEVCLGWALNHPHGYLGMIGSRSKIALLRGHLKAQGVTDDQLAGVHAPIGLDIGAQTPAEIAVAIAAQIIQWRYAEGVAAPELPDYACLLATIVEKYGSAPRGVGAWLARKDDGTFHGTVGGGAVEAAAMTKMEELAREGKCFDPFTVLYDLSNRDAAGLGMACGGRVKIQFSRYSPMDG